MYLPSVYLRSLHVTVPPRPSPLYLCCKRSNIEGGNSLGMRLATLHDIQVFLDNLSEYLLLPRFDIPLQQARVNIHVCIYDLFRTNHSFSEFYHVIRGTSRVLFHVAQ